jgi:hypothetical protein
MQRTAALRAWRALPSGVRREAVALARQGVAHPDPSVVRTALAAVRAVHRGYEVVGLVMTGALTAGGVALYALRPPDQARLIAVLLLFACFLTVGIASFVLPAWWGLGIRTTPRLEGASIRGLVARRPLGPPTSLTVPARRQPSPIALGIVSAFGANLLLAGLLMPEPWWLQLVSTGCVTAGAAGGALLGPLNQPRWSRGLPRRGRPVLILDDRGIAVPHLGVALPWAQVAVVELQIEQWVLGVVVTPVASAYRTATIGVPTAWMSVPPEDVLTVARDYLIAARAAAPAES